jgi:hypothetical protein
MSGRGCASTSGNAALRRAAWLKQHVCDTCSLRDRERSASCARTSAHNAHTTHISSVCVEVRVARTLEMCSAEASLEPIKPSDAPSPAGPTCDRPLALKKGPDTTPVGRTTKGRGLPLSLARGRRCCLLDLHSRDSRPAELATMAVRCAACTADARPPAEALGVSARQVSRALNATEASAERTGSGAI